MKAMIYIPLILWLALSNIIAFLMLMVAAPKAEDYAEQSLEQKRRGHENVASPVLSTDIPRNLITSDNDTAIAKSSIIGLTPQHSGIINIFEPFIGAMRPLQSVLLLAFIAGYLGGSLHALASLLHYRAHEKLTNHWTLWYIARPLKGAMTAVVFSFIIQAGLMTGVSGDSVINPIGIIALSLLVGMSAHDAMNRLGIVFSTFFNTHRHNIAPENSDKIHYDDKGNIIVVSPDGTCNVYQRSEIKGMLPDKQDNITPQAETK